VLGRLLSTRAERAGDARPGSPPLRRLPSWRGQADMPCLPQRCVNQATAFAVTARRADLQCADRFDVCAMRTPHEHPFSLARPVMPSATMPRWTCTAIASGPCECLRLRLADLVVVMRTVVRMRVGSCSGTWAGCFVAAPAPNDMRAGCMALAGAMGRGRACKPAAAVGVSPTSSA
jgi:hypothetical protein